MNEQPDEFDDLMRQRFGDFQKDPPEGVWDNILAGLGNDSSKPAMVAGRRWIAWPVAASVLLVVTGVFIGISLYRSSETGLTASGPDTPDIFKRRDVTGTSIQLQKGKNILQANHYIRHAQNVQSPKSVQQPIIQDDQQLIEDHGNLLQNSDEAFTLSTVNTNPVNPVSDFHQTGLNPALSHVPTERNGNSILSMNNKNINELNINLCNTLTPICSKNTVLASRKRDYVRHPEFYLGLNYTPTYQFQERSNDMIHGYSLDAGIQYRRILIQSGAGIEYQHAGSASIMTYLAPETVGAFSFYTCNGYDSIPIYHGDTLVDCYYQPQMQSSVSEITDTLHHKENFTMLTRYTCLNIPLMVGYQWTKKNFAFNFKAGGIYTVEIGKHKKEAVPENESAYNIKIFDRTPNRKNQWLSIVVMPEAEYYIHEHLSISAAPWFRYSFQGANDSEKINASNPYAMGLNAGFKIHF